MNGAVQPQEERGLPSLVPRQRKEYPEMAPSTFLHPKGRGEKKVCGSILASADQRNLVPSFLTLNVHFPLDFKRKRNIKTQETKSPDTTASDRRGEKMQG